MNEATAKLILLVIFVAGLIGLMEVVGRTAMWAAVRLYAWCIWSWRRRP